MYYIPKNCTRCRWGRFCEKWDACGFYTACRECGHILTKTERMALLMLVLASDSADSEAPSTCYPSIAWHLTQTN